MLHFGRVPILILDWRIYCFVLTTKCVLSVCDNAKTNTSFEIRASDLAFMTKYSVPAKSSKAYVINHTNSKGHSPPLWDRW